MLNRVQRRTQQQYKEQEYLARNEQQTCSEDYPMCSSPVFSGNEEEDLWDSDVHVDGDVVSDV